MPILRSSCSALSRPALALLLLLSVTVTASAQAVVYNSRNGSDVVSCGPLGGPSVSHTFTTTVAVGESLTVNDPGGIVGSTAWSASAASAQFSSTATSDGIALAVAGSVTRGALPGLGIWTLADGRDTWLFTITAPTRFTFSASLSTAGSEATVPPSHFTFAGFGIVPDPGSALPPYQATLTAPGATSLTASGTLLPGSYQVTLFGRAEGSTYPLSCSYSNSLALAFQPAATATPRAASGNPNSYTCSLPRLGQTWHANVDVGSTGHGFAIVFASSTAGSLPVAPGFTVLLGAPVLEFLPLSAGPVAAYAFPMPGDPGLAGFELSTQALHLGGAPTLLLSNAQDLRLGF